MNSVELPLIVTLLTSCVNFGVHIIQSNSNSLISKAYTEQLNANIDSSRWLQIVRYLQQDLGFSHVWNNQSTFNSIALLTAIKHKLRERFILFWEKRLTEEEGVKKLRTYKNLTSLLH